MTLCTQCRKTYDQPGLRFCIDDGTPLVEAEEGASAQSLAGTAPVGGQHSPMVTDMHFPPQIDPLQEGAQVGEYIVGKKIGEGGMGVIYAGLHPIIGRKVAFKVLNREMASNPDVVQRFILEAKAVNQIGHRNIIDIFSFGKLSDGRQYFAMEFLEGQSLASRLAKEIPMPWSEAIQVWIQAASAIEAAHAQGIVHRDLKPDNVYVTPSQDGPFVKLLDFGIAKLLGDVPMGLSKTSTGVPIGTPAYMSPEQARGTGVDNRTDLYAFGIILYETISGRPPFLHHNTFVALLTAHLTETPPPLTGFVDIHPELNALVNKLLAKEPADRPADMRAVREELIRLRDLGLQERTPLFAPKGQMGALAEAAREAADEQSKTMVRGSGAKAGVAAAPHKGPGRFVAVAAGVLVLVAGAGAVAKFTRTEPPKLAEPTPTPTPAPTPAPAPAPAAASNIPAGKGRLNITTGGVEVKVFIDDDKQQSTTPVAEGAIGLKVLLPAGVKKWVRVEAPGYKTITVSTTLAAGDDQPYSPAMVPNGPVKVQHGGGGKGKAAPGTPPPPGTKPPGGDPGNGTLGID